MASVSLEFIPPDEPDLLSLHVYEGASQDGPFAQIDSTEAIGTYPNYIHRYTTDDAASINDWFAISWTNTSGVEGALSAPMQGGQTSIVSELVNRVLIRDPSLNATIVGQEAEAIVCRYFNVDDPYSVPIPSPSVMQGLTYLVLAACYVTELFVGGGSGTTDDYTAGLVAQRSGSSSGGGGLDLDDIRDLVNWANQILGRTFSVVMQLEDPSNNCACGADFILEEARYDQTRLLLDVP